VSDAAARAREILADARAMIAGSHVVYTSGKHGSAYVNKDAVYPHTARVAELCRFLAERRAIGRDRLRPAMGGIIPRND
jgi:orotate phosphoribosyltransferase